MKIISLMDNKPGENVALETEHGLSFWITYHGKAILFDAGASEAALRNAGKLGIDPTSADYVVCSHGHYDHGTGIAALIWEEKVGRLVVGRGFLAQKYTNDAKTGIAYAGAGITSELLAKHSTMMTECVGTLHLFDGCYVVSGFQRNHAFETIPEKFLLWDGETYIRDQFEDEVCLVFDEEPGLTVIVGCSHPGILNILTSVSEEFGKSIDTVIGGTHLMEADEPRIARTFETLKEMQVKHIGFCHCAGELALKIIKEDPELNGFYLATGDSITL